MKTNKIKNLILSTLIAVTAITSQVSASQIVGGPPATVGEIVQLRVTPVWHQPNLCMPACASMMLSTFGWNYHQREIKLLSLNKPYYGLKAPFSDYTPMTPDQLVYAVSKINQKWTTVYYNDHPELYDAYLNGIKNSLRKGYPVLVGIGLHAIIVTGFNDSKKTITVVDPACNVTRSKFVHSYEYFEKIWRYKYVPYRLAIYMF
jgi:hypothetical protein